MRRFPSGNGRLIACVATGLLVAIHTPAWSAPNAARPDAALNVAWRLVSHSDKLTIQRRSHQESGIEEVKAVGLIDAKPGVIKRVIEDTDAYPQFMPYVFASRVIEKQGNTLVVYQRLSPPLTGALDYTMRMRFELERNDKGIICHRIRWEPANEMGPPEKKGIARSKVNEGYWLLEPTATDGQTRATYWLYSDCGGVVPSSLVNYANRTTIPKLFDGVRKRVRLGIYAVQK